MDKDDPERYINEFWEIAQPIRSQRKKRMCLKCKKIFVSEGPGNRICGQCQIRAPRGRFPGDPA